jgi:hypothetical protein
VEQEKKDGKAIASLVLGIVSCIFIFIPGYSLIGIIPGVIGLILGISSKKTAPSGLATAGIVLSIIGLAICAISFLVFIACVGAIASLGSF